MSVVFGEPIGTDLEGSIHTRVRVHRSGELRYAVALERDVVDRRAEERVTIGIEGLYRHVDVLLVGGEEQETERGGG